MSTLLSDLTQVLWHLVYDCDDVDDKLDTFEQLLLNVWNDHAPLKKRTNKQRLVPWMSSSVLVHMRQRDRTYEWFITDRTDDNWRIYRKLRHHCVYNIRQAKRDFFNKSCNKTNKKFWNIAKSCTGLGKSKARSLHWPASTPSVANSTAD